MSQVVITGIGAVSALGCDSDEIYSKLLKNNHLFYKEKNTYSGMEDKCYTARISIATHAAMDEYIAQYGVKVNRNIPEVTKYILYAILYALNDSGLTLREIQSKKVALVIGGSDGESDSLERFLEEDRFEFYSSNTILSEIAKILGLNQTRLIFVHNACASSNMALEIGYNLLKENKVDIVLAGGAECFSKRVFMGLYNVNVLSKKLCFPFSIDEEGVTIGEGGAVVVLQKKNLNSTHKYEKEYAEIVATASSNGSKNMTEVDEEAIMSAYQKLFKNGNVRSSELNYILGHATGSPLNDRVEAKCIQKINYGIPVCIIKNTLGYLLGAAGIMGVVVICKIFQYKQIPGSPYVNGREIMEKLNILDREQLMSGISLWCNNAFGMGGNNTLVLLKNIE